MKNNLQYKIYPLIPSQQTMYFMIKYSLHKQVIQIPSSYSVEEELDFSLLARALNIEIARNDCMRLCFFKEKGEIKQYFLPEVKLDGVRLLHFADEDQMESYFTADAEKPVKFLNGEIFRIFFFTCGKKQGVYLNVSHLVMDALAVLLFYRDLFAVYASLKDKTELPAPLASYEEHFETEFAYLKSSRFAADAEFGSEYHRNGGCPYYCGLHGKELLEAQRVKKRDPELRVPSAYDPIHDKSALLRMRIDSDTSKKLLDYCASHGVSPETLIQTGFRLHASHLHDCINDTFMMVLCGRRVKKSERNMGGCLAQPFMTRVIFNNEMSFEEAVNACEEARMSLYRHKDLPYLSSRRIQQDIYGLSASQGPSFMMYTWIPFADNVGSKSGAITEFRGYNPGRYVMPLYAFSFVNPNDGAIEFYYLYRTNILKRENLSALHENAVKIITSGISSPEITVEELYKMIERKS